MQTKSVSVSVHSEHEKCSGDKKLLWLISCSIHSLLQLKFLIIIKIVCFLCDRECYIKVTIQLLSEVLFISMHPISYLYSTYTLMCGSETWPVRKENEVAFQRAEMRMVRWMCGVKLQDRVPSKELRERLGLDDIILVLQQNRLRWYGHVLQKENNVLVKICMDYEVPSVLQSTDNHRLLITLCFQLCAQHDDDRVWCSASCSPLVSATTWLISSTISFSSSLSMNSYAFCRLVQRT